MSPEQSRLAGQAPDDVLGACGVTRFTIRSPDAWTGPPALLAFLSQPKRDAPLLALMNEADLPRVRAKIIATLRAPRPILYEDEFRLRHGAGHDLWFVARGIVSELADGPVINGILVEFTRRKEVEDGLRQANASLEHRVKNVLAIVQSIAIHTLHSTAAAETGDVLLSRLHALARAYDALASGRTGGASLRDLVRGEIEPFGADAEIDGPDMNLSAPAARSIALVVHELAAESTRHGALSAPRANITVRWRLSEGEEPQLTLTWSERGRPARAATSGHAMPLLGKLAAAFGGEGQLDHTPWGLKYELSLPLAAIVAGQDPRVV